MLPGPVGYPPRRAHLPCVGAGAAGGVALGGRPTGRLRAHPSAHPSARPQERKVNPSRHHSPAPAEPVAPPAPPAGDVGVGRRGRVACAEVSGWTNGVAITAAPPVNSATGASASAPDTVWRQIRAGRSPPYTCW